MVARWWTKVSSLCKQVKTDTTSSLESKPLNMSTFVSGICADFHVVSLPGVFTPSVLKLTDLQRGEDYLVHRGKVGFPQHLGPLPEGQNSLVPHRSHCGRHLRRFKQWNVREEKKDGHSIKGKNRKPFIFSTWALFFNRILPLKIDWKRVKEEGIELKWSKLCKSYRVVV